MTSCICRNLYGTQTIRWPHLAESSGSNTRKPINWKVDHTLRPKVTVCSVFLCLYDLRQRPKKYERLRMLNDVTFCQISPIGGLCSIYFCVICHLYREVVGSSERRAGHWPVTEPKVADLIHGRCDVSKAMIHSAFKVKGQRLWSRSVRWSIWIIMTSWHSTYRFSQ